jgi:hypothetical protein
MEHVLSRVQKVDIVLEPFPHVVIHHAIDASLCRKLVDEFPSIETIAQSQTWRSNQRFSLPSRSVIGNPAVTPLWQEFVAAHIAPEFLGRIWGLFGDQIVRHYPAWARNERVLADKRLGQREIDTFGSHDILLDALPSVNTPVTGIPGSVRTGHVDDPRKLLAGLFYLRRPEDDSTGGDLVLYRYRKPGTGFFENQMIDDQFIEPVRTVRYSTNVLVFFLNSLDALHGVTPRLSTSHPRIFMNLVGDTEKPLFDLKSRQYPKWRLAVRRAKRRIFGAPSGFYK